jgi:Anti-sigma factor NepR
MQTETPVRKAGGRLSREDQRRLGDILQRVYDEVIHQGVPDRFKDLLNELDGEREGGKEQAARESAEAAPARDSDLVDAKGLGHPHHKGSS